MMDHTPHVRLGVAERHAVYVHVVKTRECLILNGSKCDPNLSLETLEQ